MVNQGNAPRGGYGTRKSSPPNIGGIEPVVMRADYQLPWERQSNQTVCGNVIQNQVGDKGWRIVIEGVMTLDQLENLRRMRDQNTVSVQTQEFGKLNVVFDQLNVTRSNKTDSGDFPEYNGPFIEFQLQTKEDQQEKLFDDFGPGSN